MNNFIQEFSRGLFNTGGGNYKQTTASNLGKGTRMFVKRHPIGMLLTGVGAATGVAGIYGANKADNAINEYEQFWLNKQGHTGVPRIEDYESEEEFQKDYSLYWTTRPLVY